MNYPKKLDRYYIYCPPLSDKVLTKLRLENWKQNESLPSHLVEILPGSPKQAKDALEQLARNFKREAGFDFSMYSATEGEDPRKLGAFLWTEPCQNNNSVDNRAIGGLCFRYRENYVEECKALNGWALAWVYLHPNHRRKGLLSDCWDYFRGRFGDFVVEDPFSIQMSFFLAKNGGIPHPEQRRLYESSEGPKGVRWRAIRDLVEQEQARVS